jgi:hypothetical protein
MSSEKIDTLLPRLKDKCSFCHSPNIVYWCVKCHSDICEEHHYVCERCHHTYCIHCIEHDLEQCQKAMKPKMRMKQGYIYYV